jgi:hypothetical protein
VSGHKTREVFERYHVVIDDDQTEAVERVGTRLDEIVSERFGKRPILRQRTGEKPLPGNRIEGPRIAMGLEEKGLRFHVFCRFGKTCL